MSSSEGALAAASARHARRPRSRSLTLSRLWLAPIALALLAGLLNLWDLTRNGWANTYYAAAVRSMSASWHNFLFASFDPSGVMTVDKPPLALWIETASVKIFGLHPLAILAPQALMGVASVLLVYDLTRRRFGRPAGFVAGLVLTLTPITVAISRHDNPDALLVLCSVAALWCSLRALEDRGARWFVLAGVCVGLGFETKMLIALVVLPGILAAWTWSRPPLARADADAVSLARSRRSRAPARVRARRSLFNGLFTGPLAAVGAMLLVGGAWPLLVELTPAAKRPWISGTGDNTILSLIFGYNGLGRIEGQGGGPQALGGSNLFGGSTGPLRLLNEALGGQAGWLLGFALISAVAIVLACRLRRADPRSGWLLAVGGAFLTTAVVFSFAQGIFHPYYVSLLAPFSAALVGAGFAQLQGSGAHARILAALALAAGLATELAVLHDYPTELRWLTPTLIVLGTLAVTLLLVGTPRLRLIALCGALALLLFAPATWAVQTLGHPTNGTFPAGGPTSNPASGFGGGPGGPSGGAARGAFPGAPPGTGFGGRGQVGPEAPGAAAQGVPAQGVPAQGVPAQGVPAQGVPTQGVPAQGATVGGPLLLGAGSSSSRSPSDAEPGAAVAGDPAAATAGNGDTRGEARPERRLAAPAAGFGSSFAPGAAGHNGAAGPFGATSQSLTAAVRYAKVHGGGTVAVASQSEAAALVIDGDRVAGIGGFSGRESETNATWLAQEIRAGHIRWVLTTSNGPGASSAIGTGPTAGGDAPAGAPSGHDQRVGSTRAMAAVAATCKRISAVSGLYDCAGRAARLAAAAATQDSVAGAARSR